MKGMLKAEFFKFSHSATLWVIIGVLVACCSVSVFTGVYHSAEDALVCICKDNMVPILACAIYAAIILTGDFSNGLLRHYVANGYTRASILFAKFLHYLFGCALLLLLYPAISVLLTAAVQGIKTSFPAVLSGLLVVFLKSLPLYGGIFSLFFLFSVLMPRGAVSMGVSVAVSIITVVFTNKLYGNGAEMLRYSPIIQLQEIAKGAEVAGYGAAVALSLLLLAACVGISAAKFRRDEL